MGRKPPTERQGLDYKIKDKTYFGLDKATLSGKRESEKIFHELIGRIIRTVAPELSALVMEIWPEGLRIIFRQRLSTLRSSCRLISGVLGRHIEFLFKI